MSQMHRSVNGGLWVLGVAGAGIVLSGVMLSALGCADDAPGTPTDADVGAASDAGIWDASLAPSLEGETSRADSSFAGCLDGDDADEDTRFDCADDECVRAPACCVGSTAVECCAAITALTEVPLADCGARCGDVASVAFGAPDLTAGVRPTRADADGGLTLDLPMDLRGGRIELRARIAAPPGGPGLDVLTFGLTPNLATTARMLPTIGAQVNGALRTVSLVVGETVVDTATLPSGDELEYVLTAHPDGRVTLTGASIALSASVLVQGVVYPTVFGRVSDGSTAGALARTLAASRLRCDVPAALGARPITLIDEAGAFVSGSEANPMLTADAAGTRFLAFDAVRRDDPTRRGVFVAEEAIAGELRFVVRNPGPTERQPVLGDSLDVEQFTDPDLMLEGGVWVLYVAGEANGRSSLFRAQGSGPAGTYSDPVELMMSAAVGSLDSPTRLAPNRVLARETDLETGQTRIVELGVEVSAGLESDFADGICGVDDVCESPEDRRTRFILTQREGNVFDSDEVDAPSVVSVGGAYRLYYAGRRGTRWTSSVVVSEDSAYWRRISQTNAGSDVVLGPDSGIGALGVRGMSASSSGGVVTLVFEAYGGTRSAIWLAEQR
jgi:hypothetical protein